MDENRRKSCKLLTIMLWIISSFTIALLVFTRGFLLTRIEVGNRSSVTQNVEEHVSIHNAHDELTRKGSWPTFDKMLIIVIDGLRYDFLSHNSSVCQKKANYYQNKFSNLYGVLSTEKENGRIFRFIADSPTTTVQRVKAITTGSLPSFVEASANFASTEILEDNMIHQLYKHNKSIVIMGDEVWVDLYPRYFLRQYPYPPFDVKDIDTVDNGVISHLIPEMNKTDWHVIIAHFLGVDHCGHSRGPDHPDMERKLKQMDQVLKDVIHHLDDQTILYVFGDHGMTAAGGHGGDSPNEVDAGLLIYSKRKIFPKMDHNFTDKTVRQVDIVPTISLQLNIPISFSNLGTVIEDLFLFDQNDETKIQNFNETSLAVKSNLNLLVALRKNAKQVIFSVKEYFRISKDTEDKRFEMLERIFKNAEEQLHQLNCTHINLLKKDKESIKQMDLEVIRQIKALQSQYKDFLHQVLLTCQEIWAKFDHTAIVSGLIMMTVTLLCCLAVHYSIFGNKDISCSHIVKKMVLAEYIGILFIVMSWIVFAYQLKTSAQLVLLVTAFQIISMFCFVFSYWPIKAAVISEVHIIYQLLGHIKQPSILVFLIYLGIFLSDSITIQENVTLLSLIQIMLISKVLLYFFKSLQVTQASSDNANDNGPLRCQLNKKNAPFKGRWNFYYKLGIVLAATCSIRLSAVYWNCREEQQPCIPSIFLRPFESMIHTANNSVLRGRFLLAISSVLVLLGCILYWCKKTGSINTISSIYVCVKLLFPVGGLCIMLHWTLLIPSDNKLALTINFPWLQQVLFPRLAYCAILVAILCLLWDPLGIYVLRRDQRSWLHESSAFGESFDENVQILFRNLRDTLSYKKSRKNSNDTNEHLPPIVYGLGSAFSTAFFVLLAAFALLMMMLLSDGLAFSVILMIITTICLITDESLPEATETLESRSLKQPSLSSLVTWNILSSYWFFATGHQATIASIPFNAAFVGFQGDPQSKIIPGLLILLNMFSAQIIFALSLPLLYIWNVSKIKLGNTNGSKAGSNGNDSSGEMILRQHSTNSVHGLWVTVLTHLTISMIKVMAIACAAAFHRHHFMLWKVFAPRFVFEAAGFLFSLPFLFFGYLFFYRIDSALDDWTVKLEKALKTT